MILLSIPLGLFLELFKGTVLSGFDSTNLGGSLGVSLVTALVFMAIIVSTGYLLGIKEIKEVLTRVIKKIKNFAGK
jgi:hypothetical protein